MATDKASQRSTRPLRGLTFALLATLVGIVGGIGAAAFRALIAVIHNGLFLGQFSFTYDANQHTPASPWGALVIFVPVLGALGVVFLVKNFAPEAKGHGVPEVMDAIYYHKGVIRPVVAVVKSFASALSIGSGGSIGREGPIIQIGSSFGSTVGQILRVSPWQRITLIACGAGAGIAATFNTPIGGVLFVIELMMHEVSVRTLVPVAIATATATYVGQLCFGANPSFVIPVLEQHYFHVEKPLALLAYVGLGVLMGAVSALFIKAIYGFEDFFGSRFRKSYYLQHLAGMLTVGVMMYAMFLAFGHYYIEGVGYAALQDLLSGSTLPLALLLLLFGAKLLATALTLGSGASGGVFSPSLFLGGTLGGAYGLALNALFPTIGVSPPAFAIVGMAAVVSGVTGAAVTAIVMTFEMTRDYSVVLPMTIVAAISYAVRRTLVHESIYTMKLARRGHYIPDALQANTHFVKRVVDVMETPLTVEIKDQTPAGVLKLFSRHPHASCVLAADDGKIVGFFVEDDLVIAQATGDLGASLSDVLHVDYVAVTSDTSIFLAVSRLRATNSSVALVTGELKALTIDSVQGLITHQQLGDVLLDTGELFVD